MDPFQDRYMKYVAIKPPYFFSLKDFNMIKLKGDSQRGKVAWDVVLGNIDLHFILQKYFILQMTFILHKME